MRRKLLFFLLAMPLCIIAQSIKIGVVDESIIKKLPQYTKAMAEVNEISDRYKVEYEKLEADMNKKVTEYQALNQESGTPENIRLLRIQEIQTLNERIQQFRNAATNDLQRIEKDKMDEVHGQFDAAVAEVAKDGAYTVVYYKNSVAYTTPQVIDITPAVLERLLAE